MNLEGFEERSNRSGTIYYTNANGEIVAKVCGKCRLGKTLEEYSKHTAGLGGRRSTCRTCRSESDRKYDEQNSKKKSERNRNYREANKELTAELSRKWRVQNKERMKELKRNWSDANKERHAELMRNWRIENPDRALILYQRRRARKKSLLDDFTKEQMKTTFDLFGGCALTRSCEIHWDHVIPLATGHGGTIYGNMIPLRPDLNQSKNDANIFEWFEANRQRFSLEQERFDRLIDWLGKANGMTVEEYRDYVYECHANPNAIDDAKAN